MSRLLKKRKGPSKRSSSSSSPMDDVRLGTKQKLLFQKHKARPHLGTRYYHEADMIKLGVHDEIVRLFSQIGAHGLLQLPPMDSYPALTSEFLATFEVKNFKKRDCIMTFQLGNTPHRWTLNEFNVAIGLLDDYDKDVVQEVDYQRFWYKITGKQNFSRQDCSAVDLIHPCFKVVQKVLGNSIYGRHECSKVRKTELQCLWAMTHNKKFALGPEFVEKIEDLAKTDSGAVVIGGYIALIAHHLGIDLSRYSKTTYSFLDIPHLERAGVLIRDHDIDYPFNYLRRFRKGVRITAECVSTTSTANWLTSWVGQNLPTRNDDSESEEDESEEANEEGDVDVMEPAVETLMLDSPTGGNAPTGHFEQGGSSCAPEDNLHSYYGRFDALERKMDQLQFSVDGLRNNMATQWQAYERHMVEQASYIAEQERQRQEYVRKQHDIYQMQYHMYYHTMGRFYDPTAPFPSPPRPPQ